MPLKAILAALALSALAAPPAAAAVEITWENLIPLNDRLRDLMPDQETMVEPGVVYDGTYDPELGGYAAGEVSFVHDYDGKTVRLPGYMVPFDFEGTEVREFLLVPYVGACIHVPPPPPNQLVFVTSKNPVPSEGLFEPVWVEGTFGTNEITTELAEVGYRIEADEVEPYEVEW